MIPPRGFKAELYPLRHQIKYSFGLAIRTATQNSAMATLVRNYKTLNATDLIEVNPHNTAYVEDAGAVCAKMSIIDKLRLSIRFNMTEHCADRALTSGTAGPNFDDGVYTGDSIDHIRFLWRPIFFSFPEKLDAADDNTTTTVKAILNLTPDATQEDVVPISVNKLPEVGNSELPQPLSTVNLTEVATTHYNMTASAVMEDVAWDETLFQDALRRYTNKGALKSVVGRTRYVNLTRKRPFMNFYIDKFVPKSIRRIQPYSFFAILIHMGLDADFEQDFRAILPSAAVAHLGVKIIANYNEWNADHYQDMKSI